MTPDQSKLAAMFPNMSESTRRRNAVQGAEAMTTDGEGQASVVARTVGANPATAAKPKPRMNKLELRFYEVLKTTEHSSHVITPQFRIRCTPINAAVPVHYTADFLVSQLHDLKGVGTVWRHTLYECKHADRPYHSDELNRPKLVVVLNPWISQVILATWDEETWSYRQIA